MHADRFVDIRVAALLPSLMLMWVIDEVVLVVSCGLPRNVGLMELLTRTWFGVKPLRMQT